MLVAAIICFVIAILLGLTLFSYILRDKNTPKGLAIIHGGFAATGLVLLILYGIMNSLRPIVSIILFIMAAMGGFFLFYRDLFGKSIPKWLVLGHGLLALSGFIFLIVLILKM